MANYKVGMVFIAQVIVFVAQGIVLVALGIVLVNTVRFRCKQGKVFSRLAPSGVLNVLYTQLWTLHQH